MILKVKKHQFFSIVQSIEQPAFTLDAPFERGDVLHKASPLQLVETENIK